MNAPTLIVGLGGKGSEIVLRVSKLVSEEEKRQIEFVVFDTDVNELRKIKQENPFVKTVQTSTSITVGEYLDTDINARDNWFPVNHILNNKAVSEGAGQVRAISRLAFESAVRNGKLEELDKAIENLYKLDGNEYNQALRVIVVSSLAGGTGSGLILPVGLYIKNFMSTRFRQNASISRGFFLLPEVFYGVITGTIERENLKSNAYATLRELDAFMMKGDASLPKKYANSVVYRFPLSNTGEYEEYDVRPYDYCFLFDAQNIEGKKLNSFEDYLNHAASCIYAQSIGPMNKRSNSSEDNTIRALAKEGGRNRYAGAGTSILKYPFEDVKEFVALNWAKQSISEQWMLFDRMYKEQKLDNDRRRKDGVMARDIDLANCYITSVKQAANNKEPFAMQIINSCHVYDKDGNVKENFEKWNEYIRCIIDKITEESSKGQKTLDLAKDRVTDLFETIVPANNDESKIWNCFVDTYNELHNYQAKVEQYTEDNGGMIAYTIFKPGDNNKGAKHRIENYLVDSKQEFIHPSAIRYFLYNALKAMETALLKAKHDSDEEEAFFRDFDKNYLDDDNTARQETINDIATTHKLTTFEKIRRSSSLGKGQEALKDGLSEYLENINNYRKNAMLVKVLTQGLHDIKELSDAFENFYVIFDSNVSKIDGEIKSISKKYRDTKGKAARYVCASEKCLNGVLEDAPYLGTSIALDGKLSNNIFDMVQEYAVMPKKPKADKYFDGVFEEILNYFRNQVVVTRSNEVDMDIITAIEKEAEYEVENFDAAKKEIYVKQVIEECKILSSPFIEKPLGEEKQPIHSCAFSKYLDPNDDSPRSDLVKSELLNYGGEPDEDIPKNMIFFYNSFYGLRANDLSKFAPGKVTPTFTRMPGEYYKAYYSLISTLNPSTKESKAISPHIDKWWHIITKMPDLDEESQTKQEMDIYRAFFLGLLNKYFERIETDNLGNIEYVADADIMTGATMSSRRLVVSNGTPCDTLYEVLDSLAIYPMLVKKILDKAEETLKFESEERKIKLEKSSMLSNIKHFRIDEYPLSDGNTGRSILDLPVLFKKSITRELYFEEKVHMILEVEFEMIHYYVSKFCDGRQQIEEEKNIIMSQFEKYISDMMDEYKENDRIFKESIFNLTCNMVEKELRKITMFDEANSVADKADELKNLKKDETTTAVETSSVAETVTVAETDTAEKATEEANKSTETVTDKI